MGGQELPDALLGAQLRKPPGAVARGGFAHTAPGNWLPPGTPAGGRSSVGFPSVHGGVRPCAGCVGLSIRMRLGPAPSAARCTRCSGPMARRGTDSTGIALYGAPQDGSYVVRARIDANHGTPERVLETLERAGTVREHSQDGPNLRARIAYSGDLGELTDQVEAEPARRGVLDRTLDGDREGGRRRQRRRARLPVLELRGQPRDRPHPHGHRVGRRRRPLPPVLGAAVPRHLGRPQRPHHELPQAPPQAREPGPPVRDRQRLRGDRGLHRRQAGRRREPRGRAARLGPGPRRHVRLPDLDRRRHRRRPRPVRAEAAALRRDRRGRHDRLRGGRDPKRRRRHGRSCRASWPRGRCAGGYADLRDRLLRGTPRARSTRRSSGPRRTASPRSTSPTRPPATAWRSR